ncbi:hypothetical protein [Mycolicibacterium farcinogenes]|uniref:Uncharacterized protein n=1 Tax=Mycolicibacterium farcinogenes TaxID=1802 RepID=A0ACD1FDC5_MYCFR|nr:hypothetical protein [Mycolicibacterium farcinogenes]QZH65046.1 hypothetical protein K6L26_24060 [Mycolicibacterium farcinogenes]
MPKQIDVVHACLLPPEPWMGVIAHIVDAKEPIFAERGHFMEAACGRHVRVYLAEPFDVDHPKACQECKGVVQ